MSQTLSEPTFNILRVNDPRLNFETQRTWLAPVGAANVNYQNLNATSKATSQCIWNITAPSPDIAINRKFYIKWPLRVLFSGPIGGEFTGLSGNSAVTMGLRAYPISRSTSTLSFTCNNQSYSIYLGQLIDALARYGHAPEDKQQFTYYPNKLDQIVQYPINDPNNLITGQTNVPPGVRNPFAAYNENEPYICRNIFNYLKNFLTLGGAAKIAYNPYLAEFPPNCGGFDLEFVEPVFLSPLVWECNEQPAFIGVTQYTVQYIFSDLKNIMCGSMSNSHNVAAQTWTDYAVTIVDDPQLLMNYLTPQPTMDLPDLISYPLCDTERYIKNINDVATYLVPISNVISDSITFHSVPDRINVFCPKDRSQMVAQPLVVGQRTVSEVQMMEPDLYLVSDTVDIQW